MDGPTAPLSELERKALKSSLFKPVIRELGDGEKAVFRSYFFSQDPQQIEKASSLYKGEYQAAKFIRRYLEELFPKAEFKFEEPAPGRKSLAINIMDIAEHLKSDKERALALRQGSVLPMHLIKPATLPTVQPDKLSTRQKFGIAADAKVLSLYIRSPGTLTDVNSRSAYPRTELPKLISEIMQAEKFDVVIVSFGSMGYSSFSKAGFGFTELRFWKYQNLTEIQKSGAPVESETVIYNDTVGLMPFVHAAADAAVVFVPKNFFEAVHVGTPTLIFEKYVPVSANSDSGSYSPAEMKYQIDLASQTQMAKSTANYDDVHGLLKSLLTAPKGQAISLQEKALPPLMRALKKHLLYSLGQETAGSE